MGPNGTSHVDKNQQSGRPQRGRMPPKCLRDFCTEIYGKQRIMQVPSKQVKESTDLL